MNTLFSQRPLTLLLCLLFFSVHAEELVVGYPEFKPYTYTTDGKADGIGVQFLRDIQKELNKEIKFVPIQTYKNGVARLKHDKIDVLLMATQNEERDQFGIFSLPIAMNNWSWFSLKNNKYDYKNAFNKKNLKIVTYDQANTHHWLIEQGYGVMYSTTDLTAMMRQLVSSRVDTIFISEEVMLEALKRASLTLDDLHIQLEIAQPMGLYISNKYFDRYPHVMQQINAAIKRRKANASRL